MDLWGHMPKERRKHAKVLQHPGPSPPTKEPEVFPKSKVNRNIIESEVRRPKSNPRSGIFTSNLVFVQLVSLFEPQFPQRPRGYLTSYNESQMRQGFSKHSTQCLAQSGCINDLSSFWKY